MKWRAVRSRGVKVREGRKDFSRKELKKPPSKLFELGVGELVAIHFPEGSYAQSKEGEKEWHGSLSLPKGYIQGAAGAGDAFCSGVLYGVHENWSLEKSLLTGTCAATACMSDPDLHRRLAFFGRLPGPGRKIWNRGGRKLTFPPFYPKLTFSNPLSSDYVRFLTQRL